MITIHVFMCIFNQLKNEFIGGVFLSHLTDQQSAQEGKSAVWPQARSPHPLAFLPLALLLQVLHSSGVCQLLSACQASVGENLWPGKVHGGGDRRDH